MARGKKVIFDESQLKELQQLIDKGVRQADIAKHFGVTDDSIRKICRENGIEVRMPHKGSCIVCGDTFYSNVKGAKVCKKAHHRTCVICGKDFIVDRRDVRDTCPGQCTSLKKYGTKHPGQAKEVIKKRRSTVREKYGVDSVSQIAGHKERIAATCLEKYGATSYAGSEVGRAATRATNKEKYGGAA